MLKLIDMVLKTSDTCLDVFQLLELDVHFIIKDTQLFSGDIDFSIIARVVCQSRNTSTSDPVVGSYLAAISTALLADAPASIAAKA